MYRIVYYIYYTYISCIYIYIYMYIWHIYIYVSLYHFHSCSNHQQTGLAQQSSAARWAATASQPFITSALQESLQNLCSKSMKCVKCYCLIHVLRCVYIYNIYIYILEYIHIYISTYICHYPLCVGYCRYVVECVEIAEVYICILYTI